LVVWQSNDGIFATRVSPDGQVLDPEGRLIAEVENVCTGGLCCRFPDILSGNCASVAFDGQRFMVAWRESTVAGSETLMDLHGAEVSPEGEVLQKFTISAQPDREGAPLLAAGGDGQVLAAYTRFVPGAPYDTRRARARLLESEGAPAPGPDAGAPAPDAGTPGPAPDAGGSPVDPPPGGGGGDGCGCRVGADRPAPAAMFALFGVVALYLVRRRRAR
ncbi:MAG TPA: MYXO-CTERM sorting domain-containing protein, partial [Haliangium sp.]|nr:MYXO-CTERM sorting domain-containing protein [Haliangium sp.]